MTLNHRDYLLFAERKADRAIRRDIDTVRRRRWTRVRAPQPSPLTDPDRPLAMFLEVMQVVDRSTLQDVLTRPYFDQVHKGLDASMILTASSGFKIINNTYLRLEVKTLYGR